MKTQTVQLFKGSNGVGGVLGNSHKAAYVQTGSGLFAQALAFVVDQAITAGQMPDRYKIPVTLSAYKLPKANQKKGRIMVFRSPMFGSSALGGRL